MKEFYRQTVKEVLDRVESSEAGLTSEQADHSREKCGWNELTGGKKKSITHVDEAAEYLGIPKGTLYMKLSEGTIPATKPGKRY